MSDPYLGHHGALASRGWEFFEIEASEPRDVERFLSAVEPGDRERVRDALSHALRASGCFSVDYRAVDPVGQRRWICARGMPRQSELTGSVRFAGVLVDITEVETSSRDAAPDALEMTYITHVRSAHAGHLLESLTHALNQPLMAILSNAEAGARFLGAPSLDIEELRSIFGEICEDTRRAVAVSRQLRALPPDRKPISEGLNLKGEDSL